MNTNNIIQVKTDDIIISNNPASPNIFMPLNLSSTKKRTSIGGVNIINLQPDFNIPTIPDYSSNVNSIVSSDEELYDTIKTPRNENNNKDLILASIKDYKNKIKDLIFVVSQKYKFIERKYTLITISIMILSVLVTTIQAISLMIQNYSKTNYIGINMPVFIFMVDLLIITIGTIITVLSSLIQFKNYKKRMELFKSSQHILLKYKLLYNRQKDIVLYSNEITNNDFELYKSKLKEYDNEIEHLNVLEDINNDDIIKITKYRNTYFLELTKYKNEFHLKTKEYNCNYEIQSLKIDKEKKEKIKNIV